MKLHDLSPAPGSRRKRTRVGRGIAAGQGKTAGRGTKGQKARAGGSIQPWFEGGQTPLHIRIPKLRGFKNPFRLEFEIVNVGRISALAELSVLDAGTAVDGSPAGGPTTVTQELLLAAGLVRTLDKPLKILGQGDVDRPLFVVADACSKSAREKIEAAGGTVQILELPVAPTAAVGLGATDAPAPAADATTSPEAAPAAEATEPGSPAEPGEDA